MEYVQESEIDLLIVGAGPSGLLAAAWASRLNLKARIIDEKGGRVQAGHADGITSRSLEILDSFGAASSLFERGYHLLEVCSWVSVAIRTTNGLAISD